MNFLHSLGHNIIIFTARRMRTHNGNIKKVKKERIIEEVKDRRRYKKPSVKKKEKRIKAERARIRQELKRKRAKERRNRKK